MGERFIIVHRSYDALLLDHLGEMLRDAGVAAKVLGTRDAAIIGVGSSITELNISVPESQAAEATDFLEAFFADEGEALLAQEGLLDEEDEDEDEDDGPAPLLPMFAGVAVLFCGLGHVYARRRITGLFFVFGFISGFVLLADARSEQELFGLGLGMGVLIISDFVGAQIAVRAYNRGVRRGILYQVAAGAIILAVTFGVSRAPTLLVDLDEAFYKTPDLSQIQRELVYPDAPDPWMQDIIPPPR